MRTTAAAKKEELLAKFAELKARLNCLRCNTPCRVPTSNTRAHPCDRHPAGWSRSWPSVAPSWRPRTTSTCRTSAAAANDVCQMSDTDNATRHQLPASPSCPHACPRCRNVLRSALIRAVCASSTILFAQLLPPFSCAGHVALVLQLALCTCRHGGAMRLSPGRQLSTGCAQRALGALFSVVCTAAALLFAFACVSASLCPLRHAEAGGGWLPHAR